MKLQVELNCLYLMRSLLTDYQSMLNKKDPVKYQTEINEITEVLEATIYNKLLCTDLEDN